MTTETTAYDYINSVRDAYIHAIEESIDNNGNSADGITAERVYDDYYDSITGDDGSYTHNRDEAVKNVKSFMYSDDWSGFIQWLIETTDNAALIDAFTEPEVTDSLIRQYILIGNYKDWFAVYDSDSYIENMK